MLLIIVEGLGCQLILTPVSTGDSLKTSEWRSNTNPILLQDDASGMFDARLGQEVRTQIGSSVP